jgi:hypothetical protein
MWTRSPVVPERARRWPRGCRLLALRDILHRHVSSVANGGLAEIDTAIHPQRFHPEITFSVFSNVLSIGACSQVLDRIADRFMYRRIINLRVTSIVVRNRLYLKLLGASAPWGRLDFVQAPTGSSICPRRSGSGQPIAKATRMSPNATLNSGPLRTKHGFRIRICSPTWQIAGPRPGSRRYVVQRGAR